MSQFLSPVECAYREISQPSSPETKPASRANEETKKIAPLTKDDVDLIIKHKRLGSPEELQDIIDHAKEFKLTTWERDQIGLQLTIAMAERARRVNGRHEDANTRFIHDTLKLAQTPYGLVEREWYEGLLRSAAEGIARCKRHQPPRCQCWADSRQILWQTQRVYDEKSPEAWAATKLYEALEEMEVASRLERGPGIA